MDNICCHSLLEALLARYLVKAAGQAAEGERLHRSFSYLDSNLNQARKKNGSDQLPSQDQLISNKNFARLFEQVGWEIGRSTFLSTSQHEHHQHSNYKVAAGEVKRAVAALKTSSWEESSLLLLQVKESHVLNMRDSCDIVFVACFLVSPGSFSPLPVFRHL